MAGEGRQERNARLQAELGRIVERLAQIRRELEEDAAEADELTPEERRRGFRVIGGGAAGIAAIVAAAPAWAREHGRVVAAGFATAAGGAVITAAVLAHPGAAPHGGSAPSPFPPVPATATAHPSTFARGRHPTPHRTTVPPAIVIPSRRRSATPTVLALGSAAPEPEPFPSLQTPSLLPSSIPALPSPSSSCLIFVEMTPLNPILTLCL